MSVHRRRVDGLFDLALERTADGGLAEAGRGDRSRSARELAELVHTRGGADADVRILMPDGAHHLTVLSATAAALGRDVLVTPAGAELRVLPSVGVAMADVVEAARAGPSTDVVPIDRATGHPVDWLLVQPLGSSTSLPGWFDLVGGLVLPRVGVVTIPLPGGLSLANRADFVTRRADAARLGMGHPALVTVAVQVRSGGFVVFDYSGRSEVYDGQLLAAALSSLPLFGADVRLWLEWPDSAKEQHELRDNLGGLAETVGATVWAPTPGGRVEILEVCRDLAVRDQDGRVSEWDSYHASPRDHPPFVSDLDGRLVPVGGLAVNSYEGAPLVSVPLSRMRAMADRYAFLPERHDVFIADIAVLDDGRPAVRYGDGTLLALGPRQFRQVLEATGWRGTDIALLCEVPPERIAGLRRCLASLGAELGCEIMLAADDKSGRSRDEQPPEMPAQWETAAGRGPSLADPEPFEPMLPEQPQRPRLLMAPRDGPPHGVRWLTDRPQVNAEAFDLLVASDWDAQRAVRDGVPGPHLFLLGRLDERRLAAGSTGRYLLRVRVGPGGAVDVSASGAHPPSEVRHLLSSTDIFLLPGGWLPRTHIVAGLRVDSGGGASEWEAVPPASLTIRCAGSRHGVDGLPNEVELWPRSGLRSAVLMFVLLARSGEPAPEWLGLHRRPPPLAEDVTLVELSIGRGRAIDVDGTAAMLAPLTSVRSRAGELREQGSSLILPRRSYDRVKVVRAFRSDGRQWRPIPTDGVTLG